MTSHRLRVQFETLFEHFNGKNVETQIDDITEVLFCTRRNARIVLNKLEEQGWVEWHPAAGRGKLSQLIFKRSRNDVSENLARRYLEEGKVDQALSVLDQNATKLTQVIQNYLGLQHQEGLQVVRLPYYRPLSMLNPRKPMRRSEQHIARQVFSGLTKFDEEEEVQPDLAHMWEAISECHWRFYIRPNVRFHNGELLTINHIIQSLLSLRPFPLFNHIECVKDIGDWVVDVVLTKPDAHFPTVLAEVCAKVLLPPNLQADNFDQIPIGTGPYKVISNDDKRLVLQAFDGYFGYRPLLDKVEVCVIEEVHSTFVYPSLENPLKSVQSRSMNEEVELDPGCSYLLLNRLNGVAKDDRWAAYLSSKLNTLNLFRTISEDTIISFGLLPAHGLKPGWYHQSPIYCERPPEEGKQITIAYHAKHPMYPAFAGAIQKALLTDGIEVTFIHYEHTIEDKSGVDIWLKAMDIASHRHDAFAGWLLNYSDIADFCLPNDFDEWLILIDRWRSDKNASFPAKELGKSLVEKHQILPLFHNWLGVNKDQCGTLQNAKCNALGWFDFSSVWVKPKVKAVDNR
jgi:SgrR family transcriptional regulator